MSNGGHEGNSRLPRFSLDRPVTVLVLAATAMVLGIVAAVGIPIELVPDGFDNPYLRIWVPWRDAPPREVLEKIVEPLEAELSTVKGIDRLNSASSVGTGRVWMRFKQNTDMDLAYREVRDRVERARRQFPDDADRVYIFKDDISGIPVFVIGAAVDESVTDAYNLIQKQIIMPLERIDGVASVEANGLEEKEILIELDRGRMEASGLNIYDLAQTLGSDSFTMASGHVREGHRKLLLRSVAKYKSLEEIENRLITPSVRVKDVATVTYEEPDKQYRVRAMSEPAYAIVVFKEGDANATEVSRRLRDLVEDLQEDPRVAAAVQLLTLWDEGDVIEESLSTLLQSGGIGAIIAGFVLFFFLRRFRVTTVVNLAVPLSLLMALSVMFFAGETLNIVSLLALMVCVGLLVDNSVVVAENIDRMHARGKTPREAAISGASEIGLAITMSTLTTIVVFLPVSLVEGEGQFWLQRMAIPICVALAASLLVALVVIPLGVMLTLPRNGDQRRGRNYERANAFFGRLYRHSFERMNHVYNELLGRSLRHRFDMVLALVAVFAVTWGFVVKEKAYVPVDVQENEQSGFHVEVEMPDSYTLEETEAWFLESEKIVQDHAAELDLEGWFLFHMKTRGELQGWFNRPRTNDLMPRKVTERVVELLPKRPGVKISTGEESQVEDPDQQGTYRVTLHGENAQILEAVAKSLEDLYLQVDGVVGARRDSEVAPNELGLVVDRDRTQHFGINPQVVAGLVGYALRGQGLPKYHAEGREIPVRVRYREEDRSSLDELASFWVPTSTGDFVPLSAVTEVHVVDSRETIWRQDKRISRHITLDLAKDEEQDARERLSVLTASLDLPEGVSFTVPRAAGGMDEDVKGMLLALMLSVIFIYLLMGLLFESFILPLSIISTIPLASLGVFWIHFAFGLNIDFLGYVAVVILVGVVVNNGIVLVDYVNRLRQESHARGEAILLAADRRFRPIMMTALTTVGGMIPLAVNGRMDSGISYTSFALTLIGGMTTATLLTLLVVPIFYTFFDDLRLAFGNALDRVRRWRPGLRWRRSARAPETTVS